MNERLRASINVPKAITLIPRTLWPGAGDRVRYLMHCERCGGCGFDGFTSQSFGNSPSSG